MPVSIPFYPLIVVPVAIAAWSFWLRARRHIEVLRAGRPLDRSDRPWERLKGLGASFHAPDLVTLADEALDSAPGEPVVIRKLEGFAGQFQTL